MGLRLPCATQKDSDQLGLQCEILFQKQNQFFFKDVGAGEVIQQVKTLVAKPGVLKLISGTYMVEKANDSHKLSSYLHIQAMACDLPCTHK